MISDPTPRLITRRSLMAGSTALGLALLASPAHALTQAEASALIGQLVAEINTVINSGRPEAQMFREFERIFTRYGDVPIIARSALGPDWRRATQAQQSAFITAFSGYLARKYGRRFREFIGGQIEVTGTRETRTGILVTSVARLRGQSPFTVEWQVSNRSGQNKMFNLYIEGVNMLATERTEIGAMLDRRRGNIDQLIADLRSAG